MLHALGVLFDYNICYCLYSKNHYGLTTIMIFSAVYV